MSQQGLLSVLDPELRKRAIDLAPYGVNEYGFPARSGRKVLFELLENRKMILGGDLWVADADGSLRPGHDNWYVNRIPGESFNQMSMRAVQESDAFFERSENDPKNIVTFVVGRE